MRYSLSSLGPVRGGGDLGSRGGFRLVDFPLNERRQVVNNSVNGKRGKYSTIAAFTALCG